MHCTCLCVCWRKAEIGKRSGKPFKVVWAAVESNRHELEKVRTPRRRKINLVNVSYDHQFSIMAHLPCSVLLFIVFFLNTQSRE